MTLLGGIMGVKKNEVADWEGRTLAGAKVRLFMAADAEGLREIENDFGSISPARCRRALDEVEAALQVAAGSGVQVPVVVIDSLGAEPKAKTKPVKKAKRGRR